MARRFLIAVAVMALGAVFAVPAVQADTGNIIEPQDETSNQGFQAGTCIQEVQAEPAPPKNCSVVTPGIFFKKAGGHPPIGFTQYTIQHQPFAPLPSPPFPAGSLQAEIKGDILAHTIKTLRVDLPPGLTVNPEATPSRCPLATFLNSPAPGTFEPACAADTKVGVEKVTLVTNKENVEVAPGFIVPVKGFVIPPTAGNTEVDVYNIVPKEGEPAKFGFVIGKRAPIFLETQVAWENDFHESFTIKLPNTAELTGLSTLISRLVNFGDKTGDGTYITNPTTCFDPNETQYEHLYSTWFRAESYGEPNPSFPEGSTPFEAKLPLEGGKRIMQEGCETIPFDPSIQVNPGTSAVDSPAPAAVTVKLPFDPAKEGGAGQSQSHLRKAEVTMPEGMGLNPSGANGLVACTDAQFRKGQRISANECPAASDVGSVEVDSPPLAEPLLGDVYVGEQK